MKKPNKIKLLIILAFIGIMGFTNLYAEEEQLETTTIKGQIVDENAAPLSNLEVKAFLTKKFSITDKDGNFEIAVASKRTDRITIDEPGYCLEIVTIYNGVAPATSIVLRKEILIAGNKQIELPFAKFESNRIVSSIDRVSGSQLESYPSASFLEKLSGLLPGVVIQSWTSVPGEESNASYASVRGESAVVYVDGVIRDPSDLSSDEVEFVQVLKDLPSRAALGIYGSRPAIWIVTKRGESYNREIKFTAEYGMNSATAIPEYVDGSEFATLYNQALTNDGLAPYYSDEAINAYKNNSDPLHYPNINYLDKYVRPSSPFRKANIHFSGGDEKVNYYSMIGYLGSEGLEAVGEKITSDRLKLRGNVNIMLNDIISMNVNISGMYKTGRRPHNNIFYTLSELPSNAHPISFGDNLLISSDYPTNIENDLMYSGFQQSSVLSTQNNATLKLDLSEFVEGLSANFSASFDATSNVVVGKFENAALYRLTQTALGADTVELVTAATKKNVLSRFGDNIARKTIATASVNYDRTFGKHAVSANISYYQGNFETKSYMEYQPEKMQDFSLRAGYTYNEKYVIQVDQVLSGSMRMAKGKRFSLYPTVGFAWIASNEDFLKGNKTVNYLKLNASYGIMGLNEFGLSGYNSYYLYQTLWQTSGSWTSGTSTKPGTYMRGYVIKQEGSSNYTLPKIQYMNVGIQSSLFNNSLAFELNYYNRYEYDIISQRQSIIPSLYGSGGFLPASNYGEILNYGFDGLLQYNKEVGDFALSVGVNALYTRGKYIVVDEPANQEEYRKYAGKEVDEFVMYNAEGLFMSQPEIDSRSVFQTFGDVKPGDIKYTDYNNDGFIDEKDQYRTGAHAPRLHFGGNLSLGYKGFKVKAVVQGATDGQQMIASNSYMFYSDGTKRLMNSYFSGTGSEQNFSKPMLDSWTEDNKDARFPRLTTSSNNNMQRSSFWLVDASYIRLKNIEVSYTLSKKASKKMLMGNCTLFVRGSNVFTASALSQYGVDAENIWAGTMSYPIFNTYTVGISCMF